MLARNLIAAAGNAGGGVSYWIDEWVPPNNDEYTTRVAVNSNRSSILLVAMDRNASNLYPYFIEFDYDGTPLRKSSTTVINGTFQSDIVDVFPYGSDYVIAHQNTVSAWSLSLVDETSSTNLRLAYKTYYNNTPYEPYATVTTQSSGYQAGTQRIYANDSYIAKFDGGDTTAATDPYYVTAVGAAKLTYSGTTLTASSYSGWTTDYATYYDISYDDVRNAQISAPYGSNYHLIRWWNYQMATNWYSTWNASTGSTSTPRYANGSGSYRGIKLGVNPTNGYLYDILNYNGSTCVIQYQTSGNVNSYYYPNTKRSISWNTVTSSNTGYIMDAAIDSDGNMYLLWGRGYIMKISSSFTVVWAASITDSTASYVLYSNADDANSIRIETVDDTEVLFVTLQLSAKSGQTTKNIQIHKLPLDLDNYYGTYGNVTYAAVSSSYVTIGTATAVSTDTFPYYVGLGSYGNISGNLTGPTNMTEQTWTVNEQSIA